MNDLVKQMAEEVNEYNRSLIPPSVKGNTVEQMFPPKRVIIEFTSSSKGEIQPTIRVESDSALETIETLDDVLFRLMERVEQFRFIVEKINGRQS